MREAQVWVEAVAGAVWPLYWPMLLLLLTAALIERAAPVEKGQPAAPLLFNLSWYACYLLIFVALSWSPWGRGVSAAMDLHSAPWLTLWDASGFWGLAGQIALVLLVFDFLAYWLHRLQHAVPVFWAVHRMHHDESHLHGATGVRQQWLQLPLIQIATLLPLAWLFGPVALHPAVFWVPVTVSVFQHMNLRLQLGRFTPLLMGPQLHRLHHATDARVYNSNFATLLPLWDILFGTYRAPAPGQFDATGIAGVAATRSFWRALMLPAFDWWAMLRLAADLGRSHPPVKTKRTSR
ncbi:MAG: sterol desaturase family protein [Betaproteobacteria bacterium]|nr:sterol desaturase family protein [Betaproteobacteria bacterium]